MMSRPAMKFAGTFLCALGLVVLAGCPSSTAPSGTTYPVTYDGKFSGTGSVETLSAEGYSTYCPPSDFHLTEPFQNLGLASGAPPITEVSVVDNGTFYSFAYLNDNLGHVYSANAVVTISGPFADGRDNYSGIYSAVFAVGT
jgi:hypothetical protein